MSDLVISPLTGKPCEAEQTIAAATIVALYRETLGLDVRGYFAGIDAVQLYRCPLSGYRFFHPQTTLGDAQFYVALKDTADYYAEWKWENEIGLGFIHAGDSVLDIGCGDGSFVRGLLGKRSVQATGIDTNPAAIAHAQSCGAGEFVLSDTIAWSKHAPQYDVVTCFQILEHIPQPLAFLQQALRMVRLNGLLIVAVPNNNPYLYHHDLLHTLNLPPHHAGLWDRESLEYLATLLPITKIETSTQPINGQLNYYERVQLEYFRGRWPLMFDSPAAPLVRRVYGKMLRWLRNRIEGHSIAIVFRKSAG